MWGKGEKFAADASGNIFARGNRQIEKVCIAYI